MNTGKILITGASGLIGSALCKRLLKEGWELIAVGRKSESLFRKDFTLPCQYYQWANPTTSTPPKEALDVDSVVHLMGEPIATKRWTPDRKKTFYDSRIETTKRLVTALKNAKPGLETFISA